MRKRFGLKFILASLFLVACMALAFFTGCGAGMSSGEDQNAQVDSDNALDQLGYAALLNTQFEFSSGAGGWWTTLFIYPDGSFFGQYSDSDMGDTGDGYEENGTLYVSSFSGHFTDLKKVDEYSFEFEIKNISYVNEPGTEEIVDGTRYIYTSAYGLDDGKSFKLYSKNTPRDVFSDETYSWISMSIDEDSKTSGMYVLENVDMKEGFTSCDYDPVEYAKNQASLVRETYDYYQDKMQSENLTQTDYNLMSEKCYHELDNTLNLIWNVIKYTKSDDEFSKILSGQKEWNKEKEASAKAEAAEYSGGSIEMMIYYDSLASSTMERIEELAAML